jgi:hypothetical protein
MALFFHFFFIKIGSVGEHDAILSNSKKNLRSNILNRVVVEVYIPTSESKVGDIKTHLIIFAAPFRAHRLAT